MGSYLSIVNDTSDTFYCNIGPDTAALAIAEVIMIVVGVLATIVTVGAGAPGLAVTFSASGSVATVSIASTSTAVALANAFGLAAQPAAILLYVMNQQAGELRNNGYQEIPPGGRYQWGKMSLSLWQQGHCVRHRSFPESMTYITDEVFLRPIFSGATDNSNIDHTIQYWIDKFGFENEKMVEIPPPPDSGGSWGDVHATLPDTLTVAQTEALMTFVANTTLSSVVPRKSAPTEPFVCDVCGNNQSLVRNLNTRVFIPNMGFLTCGDIAQAAQNLEITADDCPLLAQHLTPCGCPALINPNVDEIVAIQTASIEAKIDALTLGQELILNMLDDKVDELASLILRAMHNKTSRN